MNEIYVYELHKRKCGYKINKSTISVLGKALRTPATHLVCVGVCTGEAYVYAYMYMECKVFKMFVCVA